MKRVRNLVLPTLRPREHFWQVRAVMKQNKDKEAILNVAYLKQIT